MTEQPRRLEHPYGAAAPTRDFIGLAASGVGAGILLGVGLIATMLWLVRTSQIGVVPSEAPDLNSATANILLYGTPTALFVAGVTTYSILRPIGSSYRQGGLAMVAAFASLVVSLVTMPLDRLAGRWGLALFALACGVLTYRLVRRAARQARAA